MTALKRIIKFVKTIAKFGVWYSKDTNDVLARYFDANWARNVMIERVHRWVIFMWVTILSPR